MKRSLWLVLAVVFGAAVGTTMASVRGGGDGGGDARVGAAVSEAVRGAIADGRLGVFGPGERAGDAWGQVCVGFVEVDGGGEGAGERVTLTQRYVAFRPLYFYPASTIKLYGAIAAYEQMNALARMYPDAGLSEDTALRMYPLDADGPVRDFDPTHVTGFGRGVEPGPLTVAREAHKLFVVSDNGAFNTLYDLVGQDDLNRRIRAWGARDSMVVHRLSVALTAEENRRSPRVDLGGAAGSPQIGERVATMRHPGPDPESMGGLSRGRGFMRAGVLVEGAFDFGGKNYSSLADLQRVLVRLVRADVTHLVDGSDRVDGSGGAVQAMPGRALDLTDGQRARLIASAAMLPRESESPEYDPAAYPDGHVKFLLAGLLRVRPLGEWRVVNKIGLAYGFVTENAYVEHVPTGRSVFVAAVIHRNPNGIYNDNEYGYETTLAEMGMLGEVVGRALVDGGP